MITSDHRLLGRNGLAVPPIGLGCMGMSQHYGPTDDPLSVATIHRAIELGVTHLDTATTYGSGHNETLLGLALRGRRDAVVLATKFGIVRAADGTPGVDGRPENARTSCETSLARLQTDHLDLFYLHRVDPAVPIEDSIGAMAELVLEGKVRHLGVSEASAAMLRRASAVHPIAALQCEWSLWSRDIEAEILPTARELGIGIVPYRPLGQGFLTGEITGRADLPGEDLRRSHPRFAEENLEHNLALVEVVRRIAEKHGATTAQVALAWLLAQGQDVAPIPGTKRISRLEENAGAANLDLDAEDLRRLAALKPAGERVAFASYASH
ncbi:MAG: aldo/keto reductase [Actinomycetota bacterium]|nr:aldo/keto reductase [Actinomycetota bacterium]